MSVAPSGIQIQPSPQPIGFLTIDEALARNRESGGKYAPTGANRRKWESESPYGGLGQNDANWYRSPSAIWSAFTSGNKYQGYGSMENAPPEYANDPAGFVKWARNNQDYTPSAAITIKGRKRAEDESNKVFSDSAASLTGRIPQAEKNRTDAISTIQTAISGMRSSPGYQALTRMTDPRYDALTPEWAQKQTTAAGQAIAKNASNANAAAMDQLTARGGADSGRGGFLTAASDYRREADTSQIGAEIETARQQTNANIRLAASQAVQNGDVAMLNASQGAARIIASNPGDGLAVAAANIMLGKSFGYEDYTQFDQGDLDEALAYTKDTVDLMMEFKDQLLGFADEREKQLFKELDAADEKDKWGIVIDLLPLLFQLIPGVG